MYWSHDTCQLTQHFSSHVHSRACQMWCEKHSQIVRWFYLLSSEVRVFVGRWAVKIQNRRRTRCYSGCRCSLISENCHCLHWCDFLLQETQPSRRGVELNHCCSMSFRGTRMTNCIRRSLTYTGYLHIKLNSAKDALAKMFWLRGVFEFGYSVWRIGDL